MLKRMLVEMDMSLIRIYKDLFIDLNVSHYYLGVISPGDLRDDERIY